MHPGKSPSLRLTISYDGWKGDFADGPEGFRNKDFVLKETSFKEFGKGDKMAPGTDVKVPQELEHLVVNSQLVKDKDIGWDGHEKWAIIMTLVDSKKAAPLVGPVESSVVRSSKHEYHPNEASPALWLKYPIKGTLVSFFIQCNEF